MTPEALVRDAFAYCNGCDAPSATLHPVTGYCPDCQGDLARRTDDRLPDPCWCPGPFGGDGSPDQPESRLGHEHAAGIAGCWYQEQPEPDDDDRTRYVAVRDTDGGWA